MSMQSFPVAVRLYVTVILLKGVGGAVSVSGSGGTGIPNQQALTLRCSYTVTPGDIVILFTWRRVEGSSIVIIVSGSVSPTAATLLDSWKNKGVFVGDYTSSLDIQLPASHVTSSYAGTYRCEVSGLAESGYADVTASVLNPPSISGLPSTQTVTEFSNLRIDCSTYTTPGNPPTTSYTWTYGGSTVSTGAVLDRRNISRSQGGDYTCTASNSQGSDSASVNVDVRYGPGTSVTITPSGSLERVEGSGAFTATCTAMCNPNCTITWRKDNRDRPPGQISISNVSRIDQGTYTCQAQNGVGASQQKSITLVVYYLDSPRLTFSKSEVMENGTVTVDCDVDSNPTVEMTVTNVDNNTVLVQMNTNTLSHTIQRAQCLHNGSFVCSADNRKTGTVNQTTKSLNVLCSPRDDFRKQLNSVVVQDKYTTAYLTADIIANPPA
ncbi:hemicentin-2-like isoform X2 [Haliotis rubra]|uniref:hemicentin-2-like isoform X2 n=1 Tax=Haliotis rubra TaxID=36100 RepID=UPI001EE4F811|nr:hemicentin-2-like isoform X2 [Haliotis rubra]